VQQLCAVLQNPADVITGKPGNNVSDHIFRKLGANLHLRPDHPLAIIKDAIYQYMDGAAPGTYRTFDDLYPIVTTQVGSPTLGQLCAPCHGADPARIWAHAPGPLCGYRACTQTHTGAWLRAQKHQPEAVYEHPEP
jgi:hypothetical protein